MELLSLQWIGHFEFGGRALDRHTA
jgi:hypothetical protein